MNLGKIDSCVKMGFQGAYFPLILLLPLSLVNPSYEQTIFNFHHSIFIKFEQNINSTLYFSVPRNDIITYKEWMSYFHGGGNSVLFRKWSVHLLADGNPCLHSTILLHERRRTSLEGEILKLYYMPAIIKFTCFEGWTRTEIQNV